MAYCTKCGAVLDGRFCSTCGAPAGVGTGAAAYTPPRGGALPENIASMLCYSLGLVTGALFLLIDPYRRNPAVRFHAWQALFFGIGWFVLWIVLQTLTVSFAVIGSGFINFILGLAQNLFALGLLALWIYLMASAYQGKTVELPVVGPMARKRV